MTVMMTEEEYAEAVQNRPPRALHPVCAMLRPLRKAIGLSLAEVEERYGIPAVVQGAYERGDREPPLHKLDKLLAVYGYKLAAVPDSETPVRLTGDVVADLRTLAAQLEAQSLIEDGDDDDV